MTWSQAALHGIREHRNMFSRTLVTDWNLFVSLLVWGVLRFASRGGLTSKAKLSPHAGIDS